MAETHRARRAWADELLAQRILFDAVWTFAWRALSRYGFSDADRDDLAQDVVIAAYRGRAGYRGDRGNPEQWVSRIVRNKVHDFVSERRRQPASSERLPDLPSGGLPGDESTSVRELANIVFAVLPEDERQAVIDVAIEGYTLREIAAREGVSPSTVHERYQRGVAALRGAVDHGEERQMFAILPAALAGVEPHSDALEQAWRRAVAELGPGLGREPPASEPRRADDAEPPSYRPRGQPGRLLLLLGPLAGLLAGGALAVALMRALPPSPPRVERSSVDGAGTAGTSAETLATAPPAAGPSAAAMNVVSTGAAPAKPAARPRYQDPFDPERALVDRGRSALITGDVAGALAALEEHARRFPDGQNSAARERLWSKACARAGERDARCAGRP